MIGSMSKCKVGGEIEGWRVNALNALIWVELIVDLRVGLTVGKGLCKTDDRAVVE